MQSGAPGKQSACQGADLTPSSQEMGVFRANAKGFGEVHVVVAVPEITEQG